MTPFCDDGTEGESGGSGRIGPAVAGRVSVGIGNRAGVFHHHAMETAPATSRAIPSVGTGLLIADKLSLASLLPDQGVWSLYDQKLLMADG